MAARARTLALMEAYIDALGAASLRVPYRATLNPPLWEWGHVAWFQEWWIARNLQRSRGIACNPTHARGPSLMPHADEMYDSSRVEHRRRWELALPDLELTRRWLQATLDGTLAALEGIADESDDELYFFRLVALHEEMHAEAAAYMAESLGIAVPAAVLAAPAPRADDGESLSIAACEFTAGWSGAGFAFDNELRSHRVRVEAFEIDAQPVTWKRFAGFVSAGGYGQRRYWDDEGWAWLQEHGVPERRFTEPDAPATHLTAFEARAWCTWAGRRLPTEFEWECAALTQPRFRWGRVWEWTSSRFEPYAGFAPHPYRDYSVPWFGSRLVLRGASAATSPNLAHPKYRNFFEPHRADIFAGFRSCA